MYLNIKQSNNVLWFRWDLEEVCLGMLLEMFFVKKFINKFINSNLLGLNVKTWIHVTPKKE